MKKIPRNVIYVAIGLLLLVGLLLIGQESQTKPQSVSLSKVLEEIKQDKVEAIELNNDQMTIILKDGTKQEAFKERTASLTDYGVDYSKIRVEPKNPDDGSGRWVDALFAFLPVVFIIGFFYFIMRQAQGQNNQAMSFRKLAWRVVSRRKLLLRMWPVRLRQSKSCVKWLNFSSTRVSSKL